MGVEHFLNLWLKYEDDERLVQEVVDVVNHEEDHRAIYYATNSVRATLLFDLIFAGLYDFGKNWEWFGLRDPLDPLGPKLWESLKEREEWFKRRRKGSIN